MNKISLNIARQNRGQIENHQLVEYLSFSEQELIYLLKSKEAALRTSILGERKSKTSVEALCITLKTEKALYSRIAICKALKYWRRKCKNVIRIVR